MAMKRFLRYFLQGLLFVIPVGFTVYIIYSTVNWLDGLIPRIFNMVKPFPGFGLIIIVCAVTIIGYLGSTLIAKPAFTVFENFIYRIPLGQLNLFIRKRRDWRFCG